MGYITYGKSDVEAMIGNTAVSVLNSIEQVRQVQRFVTSLAGGPQAALEELGFTPAEAAKIITAYSTTNGLVRLADVFEGVAAQPTAVDFAPQVLAVVGPSLY